MARTIALEWGAFLNGDVVVKRKPNAGGTVAKTAATIHTALIPQSVFASIGGAEDTWTEIFNTVLNIADWLCVGIIIYAGVTWMFGNRTKAIEFLMGGSVGYIIVRHAVDIRNWLKTL